jgi:uncharacterized protein (TIGR02996 family)
LNETLAALQLAVCRHPDDDTRRLILADELEESGQVERADFIRMQVELAKHPQQVEWLSQMPVEQWSGPVEEGDLLRRLNELMRLETELLGQFGREWAKGGQPAFDFGRGGRNQFDAHRPGSARILWSGQFRRGLVEKIICGCDAWLHHGPAIVLQCPVREVELAGALHMAEGADLQRELLSVGIPVELSQSAAVLVWARRKAGLDVPCKQCKGHGFLFRPDGHAARVNRHVCLECDKGWVVAGTQDHYPRPDLPVRRNTRFA